MPDAPLSPLSPLIAVAMKFEIFTSIQLAAVPKATYTFFRRLTFLWNKSTLIHHKQIFLNTYLCFTKLECDMDWKNDKSD